MKIDIYKEFLRGEPKGFNPIYLTYRIPLINYARKFLSRQDAAEDAASDAFEVLLKFIGQFKSGKHIHNFLYLAVWYKCQIERRALQRFSILPEDAESMADLNTQELLDIRDSAIHIQHIVDTIYDKLQQLPQRRGQDFYAHFFELKGFEAIALEKGVTVATVRQNIGLAEKNLQEYLKKVAFFFSKNIDL